MTNLEKNIHQEILDSRGMQYINRMHSRTFSVNIFNINTIELLELISHINDPNEGINILMQDNRQGSDQLHREINRKIHNFVASAMTLVEHTRNFMREYYSETNILKDYENKIKNELGQDTLIKFIQDLRNYMVHNGLPPTQMFMEFKSLMDGSGTGITTTGIRIKTDKLLEWSRWTNPAKEYLQSLGEFIDINAMVTEYQSKILEFHQWLDAALENHHYHDLEKLEYLQNISILKNTPPSHPNNKISTIMENNSKDFLLISENKKQELETLVSLLINNIETLNHDVIPQNSFKSERLAFEIHQNDLLEEPTMWINTNEIYKYSLGSKEGKSLYISGKYLEKIYDFINNLENSKFIKEYVSDEFLREYILRWLKEYLQNNNADLYAFLTKAIEDNVKEYDFYAPIANLEIEDSIIFSDFKIIPLKKEIFNNFEDNILMDEPSQIEKKHIFFQDIRKKMQGLAAIYIREKGELKKVQEKGQSIANVIISLFRFLSPNSTDFTTHSSVDLLGFEYSPISNLIVANSDSFTYQTKLINNHMPILQISKSQINELEPRIKIISKLVFPENLNNFDINARTAILHFSRGSTSVNFIEKLSYCILALETILLRHKFEHITSSISERINKIINNQNFDLIYIIKEVYRIRSRNSIEPLSMNELETLNIFIKITHNVIDTAIHNIGRFENINSFLDALEHQNA
ncbi:hypothetical protein [Acinetobacter sp. CWB-B33]|uniref:hypothetical protein n=1 Tax=Acinetobacter sp. CWB-B33 TaxID=2815724 RepID=UPI0031FEECDA